MPSKEGDPGQDTSCKTSKILPYQEETKDPNYLLSLTQFEALIVARYLSAQDKLLTMVLLNKKWRQLICFHSSWYRLPILKPEANLYVKTEFNKFILSFKELTGICISPTPEEIVKE